MTGSRPMTGDLIGRPTGWEPGGHHVHAALKDLTKAERRHVEAGYIGDCRPATLRSLRNKAMFFLHIDSPNGRCGFMKLTPLGRNVQSILKARTAASSSSPATEGGV